MHDRSDAELVALARAGDKSAFGVLVERYQALALRVAVRMVTHEDLARDLAQEALLEAYLSLRHLRADTRFKNWLYGIVLNVCRTYLRDQRVQFFSLEAMRGGMRFDGPLPVAVAPSPQEIVEAHDLHQRVGHAVAALPPAEREATLLFYYDQLSVREIAATLGISPNAVKVRLHKSRQHLRRRLLADDAEFRMERRRKMIRVSVADVVKQVRTAEDGESSTYYIIVLYDESGRRALPIWVGPWEGQAIAMGLREFSTPRPMTYNFMAALLDAAGVNVESVQIASLKDETFYATVKLRNGKNVAEVDARPSDAVALALRAGAPMHVDAEVMARAGLDVPQGASASRQGTQQILDELQAALKPWTRSSAHSQEQMQQTQRELVAQVFGR